MNQSNPSKNMNLKPTKK